MRTFRRFGARKGMTAPLDNSTTSSAEVLERGVKNDPELEPAAQALMLRDLASGA
jgi:hypothetical protein